VFLNFTGKAQRLEIYDHRVRGIFKEVFTGKQKHFSGSFEIQPWDYLVYIN
jgi:hypothetical protein